MKLFLNRKTYELAKTVDYSEMGNSIAFNDSESSIEVSDKDITLRDYFGEEFKESPIDVMLDCISDEVVATGMTEDQERILPRGRELYDLYDSIYYAIQRAENAV